MRPGDPRFDSLRLGFQRHGAHSPAAIAVVRSVGGMQRAVRTAREHDWSVAVQATGHGLGATAPELLLIDTSSWRRVTIDPAARTATVTAGTRVSDVLAAAARYGLAPLSGSSPGVGAVGFTLAGGLPVLGRRFGWAAAALHRADVVLADGRFATVDRTDELGWALSGGGGSAALVAGLTIGLVPLVNAYAGSLTYATADVAAVLARWRDWAGDLPDTVSTSAVVVPFPEPGRPTVSVRVAVTAPADEAARLIEPARHFAPIVRDTVGTLPWARSAEIHAEPVTPSSTAHDSLALGAFSDRLIDAACDSVGAGDVTRIVEVRRLGGALADRTPLPLRSDAEWHLGTVSVLRGDDHAIAAQQQNATRHDVAPRRAAAGDDLGRLPNFLFGRGRDPEAVRSAYTGAAWQRLREVKAGADPSGTILAAAPIPGAGRAHLDGAA